MYKYCYPLWVTPISPIGRESKKMVLAPYIKHCREATYSLRNGERCPCGREVKGIIETGGEN
jgi:hypothetical protein